MRLGKGGGSIDIYQGIGGKRKDNHTLGGSTIKARRENSHSLAIAHMEPSTRDVVSLPRIRGARVGSGLCIHRDMLGSQARKPIKCGLHPMGLAQDWAREPIVPFMIAHSMKLFCHSSSSHTFPLCIPFNLYVGDATQASNIHNKLKCRDLWSLGIRLQMP
jgi:hypothetical protein